MAFFCVLCLGCGEGTNGVTLPEEIDCEVNAQEVDGATPVDFEPEAVPEDSELFAVGVQAGSMTDREVILWTYLQDNHQKTLRVWRELDKSSTLGLVVDKIVFPY